MRLRASGPGSGIYMRFSNLPANKAAHMVTHIDAMSFTDTRIAEENGHPPPFDCIIQLPWDVRRTQNQNTGVVVTNTVHLHEKLRLYSARCLRFALASCATQRVYLIDEYNCRLVLPSHLEQLLDQPVGMAISVHKRNWAEYLENDRSLTVRIHPSICSQGHWSSR